MRCLFVIVTALLSGACAMVAMRSDGNFCAEGWTRVAGVGCYLYLPEELTWEEASLKCQNRSHYKAKLAEINDEYEAAQLAVGASFSGEQNNNKSRNNNSRGIKNGVVCGVISYAKKLKWLH